MSRRLQHGASQVPPRSEAAHIKQMCRACEQVLVPISRQFLDLGLGVGLFLQAAKHAYVEAAADAIRQSGQRPSVSRIAALTGMQRKEIKLLSAGTLDEGQPLNRLPPVMRVIAAWRTDRDFCGADGRPRSLPIEGGEGSFKELVERYGGDVTHVAILRELQRLNWAKKGRDGSVSLSARAEELRSLGQSAAEFAARMSAYATALALSHKTKMTSSAYAGYREAPPIDERVGAALARTFSKRAEEFLSGFERWVARSNRHAPLGGRNNSAKFSMGVFFLDRSLQQPPKSAQLQTPRPTRAKRA